MTALKTNINLLSQDEFTASPVGKFFKWALTIGKYIVIVTQLVVITAFVYRFKLDRDLEALNDSIMEQQTVIDSFKDLEHNVRVLQNQLNTLKVITQDQTAMEATLTSLGQATPLQIELETLSLTQETLNITGRSLTEAGLSTLISSLQRQPLFTDITVNSVSTGSPKDPTLSFTLSATIQSSPTGQ